MIELLICIDDTDDLDSKGTGEIAEEIGALLEHEGFGVATAITRHQLYVHEDIPYTSHNSAMCFQFHMNAAHCVADIFEVAKTYLKGEAAEASDPGICIFEKHLDTEELIAFGKRAKREVLTKEMAYTLAEKTGCHLAELGGTGEGVIGAIAGIGLRLTGNDGRFRGKHEIESGHYSVTELVDKYGIDKVMDYDSEAFINEGHIFIRGKVKSVFLNHGRVLPVYRTERGYENCVKEQLRRF